ncbi:MAG: hypothetical protein J6A05_07690 [Oscillospiraceae bacterium]|nr:hypothetical protein [Oscillospiraceae bacterium]
MKKRLLYLILPVITFILEILPYGAVCIFSTSPTDKIKETFSYFDLTPFGYANFSPFLTALTTCVILIMLLIYLFVDKAFIIKTIKILLCVGVILSLCPLLYGISFFSVVGALIVISMLAELLLFHFTTKESKVELNK